MITDEKGTRGLPPSSLRRHKAMGHQVWFAVELQMAALRDDSQPPLLF